MNKFLSIYSKGFATSLVSVTSINMFYPLYSNDNSHSGLTSEHLLSESYTKGLLMSSAWFLIPIIAVKNPNHLLVPSTNYKSIIDNLTKLND